VMGTISSLLDHLDHRGLSIRSWSSRASMIWSICSIMGTARSCSTIIEYTRASWFMTDHSTNLIYWVMRWTYIKGVYPHTRYQFFQPDFTMLAPQQHIYHWTTNCYPEYWLYYHNVTTPIVLCLSQLVNTNTPRSGPNYRDTLDGR